MFPGKGCHICTVFYRSVKADGVPVAAVGGGKYPVPESSFFDYLAQDAGRIAAFGQGESQ